MQKRLTTCMISLSSQAGTLQAALLRWTFRAARHADIQHAHLIAILTACSVTSTLDPFVPESGVLRLPGCLKSLGPVEDSAVSRLA
jgi:hypothetical protein